MSRLGETFAATRAEDRAALVGYLPAGFPTITEAVAVIATMIENGVDIVEVGLPHSDPLMDGPVIQSAVDTALAGGTRIHDVMACVRATAASGAPALVMSYWNPIERYGVERFADELARAGGVGTITPDLTPEEAEPWIAATESAGLDRVFLVAPSSTDARIRTVAHATTGFVYAASTMGVTGVRSSVSGAAEHLVERVRAATTLPVCVGLGVSGGAQAAEVAGYADGVIVGSAFVRAVQSAASPAAAREAVGRLSRDLAAGVRG
ncbi:MAG: tryptophan synthase subunit alpha [Candidatus Nanopelagicales bacterium]